jgi:hypothetical protein
MGGDPSKASAVVRAISLRGPKFYREGDKVMFTNVLDPFSREPPRPATTADSEDHADAFEAFLAEIAVEKTLREAQMAQWGREPTAAELEALNSPFKPLVTFKDPEGGRPPRERGRHERARGEAHPHGDAA